jgi:hypothetical protein
VTPTQRTIRLLKDSGYLVGTVERWAPVAGKRIDLFGIIDLLAIDSSTTLGVQSTGTAFSEHDAKLRAAETTKHWLAGDRQLVLIGWRKVREKPREGKRMVYKPRIAYYQLIDGIVTKREAETLARPTEGRQ